MANTRGRDRGQGLRSGGGGGAVRRASPADPRPHRSEGRHLRQHTRASPGSGRRRPPSCWPSSARLEEVLARADEVERGQAQGAAAGASRDSRSSPRDSPCSTTTPPSTSTRLRCCPISSSGRSWRSCSPGSSSPRCWSGWSRCWPRRRRRMQEWPSRPEGACPAPAPAPAGCPRAWEDLCGSGRRTGRAGGRADGGRRRRLWLAQAASRELRPTRTRRSRSSRCRIPLRRPRLCEPLLAGGAAVCHDFKSAAGAARTARAGSATTPTSPPICWLRAARVPAGGAGAGGGDHPALVRAGRGRRLPQPPPAAAARRRWSSRSPPGRSSALRDQGMWDLFQDIELPLTGVLIAMEEAGIHLDCYRLGEITGKIQDQLEELEASIYELAGEEFNLGSPQQLGRILFERLGLARQRKTKTGYSTDAKTLEALRDSHPIVGHLLNHRELSKLMSTYLLALPAGGRSGHRAAAHHLPPDGDGHRPALVERSQSAEHPGTHRPGRADPAVLHRRAGARCWWWPTTPRSSCGSWPISPASPRCWSRSRGARTSTPARRRRSSAWRKTRSTRTHRRYAKAVNFGIMYGISAFGLSQNLGIEREEAAAYIERYFERLPRVKAFIEETIELARRQGYRGHGVRPPAAHTRAGLGQLPGAVAGREAGRQLGHPGQRRRHHQGGHDPLPRAACSRSSPGRAWCCRCTTNWSSRCRRTRRARCGSAVVEEMVAAFPMEPAAGRRRGGGARLARRPSETAADRSTHASACFSLAPRYTTGT